MAGTYAGSTSYIEVGNPATDPTTQSILALVQATALTANRRVMGKGGNTGYTNFGIAGTGTGRLSFFVDYATTDATAITIDNTIDTTNHWWVAATYTSGSAPQIFIATLYNKLAEATYNSATLAPVGARVTEASATLCIGNQPSRTVGWPGSIAFFAWYPGVALTLAQLQRQQKMLWAPINGNAGNCKPFGHLFLGGTNYRDLTGNQTVSAASGVTEIAHVPVSIFAPGREAA